MAQVVIPNGKRLPYEMDGDVKVFHLTAEPVKQEFAPGLVVNCWGYNGGSPGPMIEATEGERVRIFVTNNLPEYTTVHWHGIILPNGMDGVSGLTQPHIPPGETFVYEFPLKQSGTFMYHPHADEVVQVGMGLVGLFIIHPKTESESVDRDFGLLTQMWNIPPGTTTPNPTANEFNYFTFNGKVFPATDPLIAKKGQSVRMRWGNISMDSHPIHLHGYEFTVTRRGGKRLSKAAQYSAVTVDLPVGETRDIEFIADNPGDWALHCHKAHHLMNGMVHGGENMIRAKIPKETVEKLRSHIPGYMPMGTTGMGSMFSGHSVKDGPPNYLPLGAPGPFGVIDVGGMFTLFKVRDELESYDDPGWYDHPPGTVAHPVGNKSKGKSNHEEMPQLHQ